MTTEDRRTYILVACECKDDDRETAQHGNRASPVDHTNRASTGRHISRHEVINHQNYQVCHRDQSRNARVLEGVQAPKIRERDDNQPATHY